MKLSEPCETAIRKQQSSMASSFLTTQGCSSEPDVILCIPVIGRNRKEVENVHPRLKNERYNE